MKEETDHDLMTAKLESTLTNEPRCEETGLWGFRPGSKPGCAVTDDG